MLNLVQVACNLVRSVATIPHSERSQPCNGKIHSGYLHLTRLLVSSCVMLVTLSPCALEGIEVVSVDVVVDGVGPRSLSPTRVAAFSRSGNQNAAEKGLLVSGFLID